MSESKRMTVLVTYCPTCTMPAEYCEFSGMLEKCKPWLEQQGTDVAAMEEKGRKQTVAAAGPTVDESAPVEVSVQKRSKKKYVTLIKGLEAHGLKLKDVSTYLKKTFCCGSTISGEAVEVQGDIANEIMGILSDKYAVPAKCIVLGKYEGKKLAGGAEEDEEDD